MNHNKGNILFIILIAIGLFALLGSVVMDGETTSNKIGEDKAKLYAQDILNYANAMENTVQKMMANGVRETDLCFDIDGTYPGGDTGYEHAGCATEANKVFSPQGGGAKYMVPPSEYFDPAFSSDLRTGLYIFSATAEVYNLPMGTALNDTDLLMYVFGVKRELCIQLNNMLEFGEKNAEPTVETSSLASVFSTIHFKGSYTAATFDLGTPGLTIIHGRPAGCLKGGAGGNFENGYTAYFALHIR